jgi:hypothetical protein
MKMGSDVVAATVSASGLFLSISFWHRQTRLCPLNGVVPGFVGGALVWRFCLRVLSQDIFSVPVPVMPKTVSILTLVGGKTVYDAQVLQ